VIQCGRPGGTTMVGGSSRVITPCAVRASMSWVSKSLRSIAPIIGITIRAETIRFDEARGEL